MKKSEKGAWIVHHGQKVSSSTSAAAYYSAIDLAAKAAGLLAKMSATYQAVLTPDQVKTLAMARGLNPKMELETCLRQLEDRLVIKRGADGSVEVLGINTRSALTHAADLYAANDPGGYEEASLVLGEIASREPLRIKSVGEYISDTCGLTTADTKDFLDQAMQIGFVDHEGKGEDTLLFNGNLFRRDTLKKTERVLNGLSEAEATLVRELFEQLEKDGVMPTTKVKAMLGDVLLSKLRAAAVFDESIISNEAGEFGFVTAPGAFHKFVSPFEDDAFDQAKALVAALKYGMSQSSYERGHIWGISRLLKKLISGGEVGPAPAIGQDYRALEIDGVVTIRRSGAKYYMKLRKQDVGEIALAVLSSGSASNVVIDRLPGAAVTSYKAPEQMRFDFRRKVQTGPSKQQTQDLLRSLRSSGGL